MSPGTAAMRLLRLLLATLLLACPALAGAADAPKAERKPQGRAWASLTVEQQQVLGPLRERWNDLDAAQKRKWIGVAGRYPTMSPTEQQRVQRRMESWAKLTPDQRRQARENYRDLTRLQPDRRQDLREAWAEYQSLTPAERSRLERPPAQAESPPRERKRRAKPAPAPVAPSPQTQPAMP